MQEEKREKGKEDERKNKERKGEYNIGRKEGKT